MNLARLPAPTDLTELRRVVNRGTRMLPNEYAAVGMSALDEALGGGLPRRRMTELVAGRSAGRTSLLLMALGSATRRGEASALIDVDGTLDARSAQAAGIALERLLWVCIRDTGASAPARDTAIVPSPRQARPVSMPSRKDRSTSLGRALRAAELVLTAGGFGLIVLDCGDSPPRAPTAAWLRLSRSAERSAPPGAALLLVTPVPAAGSFATLGLRLDPGGLHVDYGLRDLELAGPARARPRPRPLPETSRGLKRPSPPGREQHAALLRGLSSSLQVTRWRSGPPPPPLTLEWPLR